jgi:predicted ATPase with chaperone activity
MKFYILIISIVFHSLLILTISNKFNFTPSLETITDVALVGGGTFPQPGEISLGHNGVLFLDELPEFKRTVLEVMRQPLEDRVLTISRAKSTVDYTESFIVVNLGGLYN